MFHIIYFINDNAKILTFPQTAKRLCRNIGGMIADNHKKNYKNISFGFNTMSVCFIVRLHFYASF